MALSKLTFLFMAMAVMSAQCHAVLAAIIAHNESSEETPSDCFSSIVSIGLGPKEVCSGVILNKRWIITSARCIEKYTNPEELQVHYGSAQRNDANRMNVIVEKVEIHPKYERVSMVNNIALIKTKDDIELNAKIRPAKLATTDTQEDEMAYAIGWNNVNEPNPSDTANTLKYYQTTVMALDLCWERVDDSNVDELDSIRIPDSVICTYGPSDKTLPPLDNGSALMSFDKLELIGIASWYEHNLPKIYTRITSMLPWIQSITNA